MAPGRAGAYNPPVTHDAEPVAAVGAGEPGPLAQALAGAAVRRPGAVLLTWALLCLVALGLALHGLGLRTDRMALIGAQHAFNRRYAELSTDFPDLDALVVVAEAGGDVPRALAFLDDLAASIAADPATFQGSFHRVPEDAFRGQALLFLAPERLQAIERRLSGAAPALARLVPEGLAGFLLQAAASVRERLGSGATAASADDLEELRLLERLLQDLELGLTGGPAPADPPWAAWLPSGEDRDGLVRTRRGGLILLAPARDPQDPAARARAVEAMRALLARLRPLHPGVSAGLTGSPALEVDEMRTWRRDAAWATLATLLSVTVLTALALRRLLAPLFVTASVGAAVVLTLGLAAIWPGQLNLISVAFCALLLGLGVSAGIHLVGRADQERLEGHAMEPAWARALAAAGPPVAGGACTTGLAFLSTLFTDVEGIREFGVVAGEGVLLSLLASTTLLPALVAWREAGRRPPTAPAPGPVRGVLRRLDELVGARPLPVVLLGLLLTAACAAWALGLGAPAPRLRWEGDLLRLQARELESVRLAEEVLADEAVAGMFAVVSVGDRERLEAVEARLRALPSVHRTSSLLDVVPPGQAERLAALARLGAVLTRVPLPAAPIVANSDGLRALPPALRGLAAALDEAAERALGAGMGPALQGTLELGQRLEALAAAVEAADPEARVRAAAWEAGLREALRGLLLRLQEECKARPLRPEDLPAPVRARFQGRSGSWLIRVYPRRSPWDEAAAEEFWRELSAVDPNVSGVPVQLHLAGRLLRQGYQDAAPLALAFLGFYLVLHFRSLWPSLVVLLSLLTGLVWSAAALALLGLPLDPASLIGLPLTVGIGVDAAIHLVHRARAEASLAGPPAVLDSGAARSAVLAAACSLACFGALGALSHHRGVASVGWACTLGILFTLCSAFLLVPPLCRLLRGPWLRPRLLGLPGPKTGPGGAPRRPPVQDPPPADR